MQLTTTIQLTAFERLLTGLGAARLATVLLFVDSGVVLRYNRNFVSVDWPWLMSNVGVGEVLGGILLIFAVLWLILLPVQLALSIPLALLFHRLVLKGQGETALVNFDTLIEYAILQKNRVAYEEVLRQKEERRGIALNQRWSFAFACLLVTNLVLPFNGTFTTTRTAWNYLAEGPPWLAITAVVALGILLVILLAFSLLSGSFINGRDALISTRSLRSSVREVLKDGQ